MVIISNGFSKFHLSVAAAEADRRQLLSSFITGAYPTPFVQKILSLPYVRTNTKAQRLATRHEQIDDRLVHALFYPEALNVLGILRGSDSAIANAFRCYGRLSAHHVVRAAAKGARIYHFRSGFGGESIEIAKRLGMFILCEHTSPHPLAEEALVKNLGKMPQRGDEVNVSPFYGPAISDLKGADAVLVNSHFVEDTFRNLGYDRTPIHVIYLGVDDAFLARVPQREKVSDEFKLLFAGTLEKRKG
ncbi:MAG: glycosyltransferase, partial [Anaerolineaceae bacterium]|nr:glycosyltransferase [Anaerolineaceae bacterium]